MYHPDTFPFQPPGKSKACCSSCEDGHGCEDKRGPSLWRFPDEGSYARGAWRATSEDASFSFGRRGLPDEPDFYQRGNISLEQNPGVPGFFEEEGYPTELENVYPVEPFEEQHSCDDCGDQADTETYMPPDKALKLEALQSKASFEVTRPGLGLPDEFGRGGGRFRPLSPTPKWPKGYALTPGWPNSDERLDFVSKHQSYNLLSRTHAELLEQAPVLTKIGIDKPRSREWGYDCKFIESYVGRKITGCKKGERLPKNKIVPGSTGQVSDKDIVRGYMQNFITPSKGSKIQNTFVGSYIAATNCNNVKNRPVETPISILDCSSFSKNDLSQLFFHTKKQQRPYLKLNDKKVRDKLAGLIATELIKRRKELSRSKDHLQFAFLDNVPWVAPGYKLGVKEDEEFSFQDVVAFLAELKKKLKEKSDKEEVEKVLLLPNMGELCSAGVYQFYHPDYIKGFLNAVDGVHVEKPFIAGTEASVSCRRTLDRALNEIYVYKKFLTRGKAIFWIDYQAYANPGYKGLIFNVTTFFRKWLAAMAMLIREKDEPLFVVRHYFQGIKPYNLWSGWPKEYGKPTTSLSCQNGNSSPFTCPPLTGSKPPSTFLQQVFVENRNYPDTWSMKRSFSNGKSIVVQSVTKLHSFNSTDQRLVGIPQIGQKTFLYRFSFDLGFVCDRRTKSYKITSLPKYGQVVLNGNKVTYTLDISRLEDGSRINNLSHFMDGLVVNEIFDKSVDGGPLRNREETDHYILLTFNQGYNYNLIQTNLKGLNYK